MRQINIVGTSPPSQPSRKIQTLPAPPDMAPANVTLRTASETSLWLRWMVSWNLQLCHYFYWLWHFWAEESRPVLIHLFSPPSLCLNGNIMGMPSRWATGFSTPAQAHRAIHSPMLLLTVWRESLLLRTWRSGQNMRSGSRLSMASEWDPGANQSEAGHGSLVSSTLWKNTLCLEKYCTISQMSLFFILLKVKFPKCLTHISVWTPSTFPQSKTKNTLITSVTLYLQHLCLDIFIISHIRGVKQTLNTLPYGKSVSRLSSAQMPSF